MKRLALLLVVTSACSTVLVRKAPYEAEPMLWPKCTEHRLFPLVDTTYAILSVMLLAAIASSDDEYAELGYIVAVPMTIGYGASAAHGWSQTSKCKRARAAYEAAALEGR